MAQETGPIAVWPLHSPHAGVFGPDGVWAW